MHYYISLGPDCLAAANLNMLRLRKISLPFDWLLTKNDIAGIDYVIKNIDTNFQYFLRKLKKNSEGHYFSENFPETFFPHCNFNAQETEFEKLKQHYFAEHFENKSSDTQIDKFKRRANRFINIINNSNNNCVFFYKVTGTTFFDEDTLGSIVNKIEYFIEKCRCKYKFLIYTVMENNEKKITFQNNFKNSHIYCQIYRIDYTVNSDFGNKDDFAQLIKTVI